MATASFAAGLAQLTGLDAETTQEQLLPHLDSLRTQPEVRNYLDSLLAPGPAAQSFIASYTAYRFPRAAASSAQATASAASGASSWASTPASSRAASPFGPTPSSSLNAGFNGQPYVKQRSGANVDDRSTGAPHHRVPIVSRGNVQVRVATAPARETVMASTGGGGKGKGKGKEPVEPELELSEEAAQELLSIARELKGFDARAAEKSQRRCFCQARQHPLSPYSPMCPSCALVLCLHNSPALRCPSCSHFPLLSSAATASHIANLNYRREELLEREKRRAQAAREQDARERAAIRFPTLGMDMDGIRRAAEQHQRSYAGHAGGGGGVAAQAERIFEARAAASAQEQKERERLARGGAGATGGRVLRLDGKTGKVKVQTKVVRPAAKGKGSVVAEETTSVLGPEEQPDGLIPFLDGDDDGVRGTAAVRSRKGDELAAVSQPTAEDGRVFVNLTLEEAHRPVWVAPDEAFVGDDDGEDENVVAAASGRPSTATTGASAARPAVPGAAVPKEEAKAKRRRGNRGGAAGQGAAN